jgi:septal ring factor EnvC (AmiA/AmiB activator)
MRACEAVSTDADATRLEPPAQMPENDCMEVLDLLLDSARRHVRHDEEDVREWARAAPPADDRALLRARITAVADRMRATFTELVETEKHHQEVARRGAWSEKTLRQIQDTARKQAANVAELLDLIARLPEPARPSAQVRADLEMLRFEADELAGVIDGEIQYWRGDKGITLEELRAQLGF